MLGNFVENLSGFRKGDYPVSPLKAVTPSVSSSFCQSQEMVDCTSAGLHGSPFMDIRY